jgi:phosphatidylserine decarboxylase
MKTLLWQESSHLVLGVTAAALMLLVLGWVPSKTPRWGFAAFVVALYLVVMGVLVWFYRVPEFAAFAGPDSSRLLAPAEGVVKAVTYDAASGMFSVVIYLNIFNQHQQYYPVSGAVTESRHTPGTFAPAYLLEKTEHNERHTTTLRTPEGHTVVVRQIAGQFARRIVNNALVGDQVLQGERMGMIKFSSRVDVLFHGRHYAPAVKVGDVVKAVDTVLAYRAKGV